MTFLTETPVLQRVNRFDRLHVLRFSVVVALTLLAAVAGPFGTFERGSFATRLVYWSVAIAVSLVVALGFKFALREQLASRHFWIAEVYICLGTTLVFTPFLYIWTVRWFALNPANLPGPVYLGLNVLAICVIISILRHGLPHVLGTAAPDLPRLADRLSDSARGAILRLEAEGHYVHIVTEQGAERVRLRLADAVREMEPVVGHFSHRSHWVAQSAIVGSGQEAGKRVLRLSNGDVVPVSRTFQPDLDAAGVL